MRLRGLEVQTQVPVPIHYKGRRLQSVLRLDALVEKEVILEFKIVETVLPVHRAQLLSYLKLADKQLGFIANFNTVQMRQGWHRVVNGLPEIDSEH